MGSDPVHAPVDVLRTKPTWAVPATVGDDEEEGRARPMRLPPDFAVVVPEELVAVTSKTSRFPRSRWTGT